MTDPSSPWAAAQRLFAALERRFVPDAQGVDFSQVLAARWAPGPLGGRLVAGGAIDGVSDTDGVAVSAAEIAGFPRGVMVVQDGADSGESNRQNFKIVDWRKIEALLE